jgi:cephalosporin-C deacetylase-like acetyl esterase
MFTKRLAIGSLLSVLLGSAPLAHAQTPPKPGDVMMDRYLAQETAKLNERVLDGARSLDEWQSRLPRLRRELLEMLGLWPMPEKTPLKATVTGTLERDAFVIEKLHFQSRPGLYVTANLYRPKVNGKQAEKFPAVVLFVGHYNRGRNGHKTFMQDHGMWFASNGYVCLILDTLTRGELPGEHLGTYRLGSMWWQAAGYTPAGVECWNGIRAIDYLVTRADVDPERIVATGLSGGGAGTFWVTALDERIRCAVPASGMTDWESNVVNRNVIVHCDCMFPVNTYGWEFTTVAALIAPRPLLFVNSHDDLGFPMAANRRIMERLRPLYQMYGKPELLDEFVSKGPAGAHEYRADSRVAIFKWINKHIKKDTGPVQDAKFEFIPEEQLRVFPEDKDLPTDAINARIDETFVPTARVKLPDVGNFAEWQSGLLNDLRAKSFRTFPKRIPMSDRTIKPDVFTFKEWLAEDGSLVRTTEAGIQVMLKFQGLNSQAEPRDKPATLIVLNEDEELTGVPAWAKELVGADAAVVVLSPRGSGPTRFTRRTPPNYVDRAHALLGRTVDQGRVWDIAATAHWMERPKGVKLIGKGQAGILAAYAALFEPSIQEVVIVDPPASHRNGPIFLNVLRVLDIPDALGLLAPRTLTLLNATDKAFDRTAAIYKLAGAEKQMQRK